MLAMYQIDVFTRFWISPDSGEIQNPVKIWYIPNMYLDLIDLRSKNL